MVWTAVKSKSLPPSPYSPASRYIQYAVKQMFVGSKQISWIKNGKNLREMNSETIK